MCPKGLIAGLLLGLACLAGRADGQPLPRHVKAELVSQTRGAIPGSTVYVALLQRIDPGWHTYWRNPGDAGEATRIGWTLPAGWRAGDIVWPVPERLPLGPLMDYGYRGQVLLPVPIEVPASARLGSVQHIAAAASFLVCSRVCVPEDANLSLDLPVVAAAGLDPAWGGRIAQTLAAAPKPSGVAAAYQVVGRRLQIAVADPGSASEISQAAYFYPYQAGAIDQAAAQTIDRGEQGFTFSVPLAAASPAPPELRGVVVTGDGGAFEIAARPGPAPPGTSGLGPPRAAAAPMTLAGALVLAFLGGLILNLMPCVLPILSMKAAAFAGHGGEARGARAQGFAFAVGVLAAFLALAGLLMGAKAVGAAVGWGFQLQSPQITGALSLVMLAAALNLSGLFEIGTSAQGLGAGLASRRGLIGAAFTGALAVVVAAPCTAPFMAPALGFALVQPPVAGLAVFAALAAGFALPLVALAFSPWLIRRLPKPGAWMRTLRQALAFPMYGAAAWLAWVMAKQAGPEGLARLFAAALALAFAVWLWGLAQRRQALGAAWRPIAIPAALALVLACVAVAGTRSAPQSRPLAAAGAPQVAYSAERLGALRAAGKPVLVNFTAAWCVTCQFNERVALTAAETADAFRRTGVVYMVGDWTSRDQAIAKALADQGRIGVPLYLVYGVDGGPPAILPQLLTPGVVVRALEAASKPGAEKRAGDAAEARLTPPAAAAR
ncbi:MAG: thioredoxin family protein [Caulobacteraceae bacterium]|nr:thioredoxin family protein [Caulobacteraceae bacterium]